MLPLIVWSQDINDTNIDTNVTKDLVKESLVTESFLTDYEYGEMLFNTPRGVSCTECHGLSGEGKVIVTYKDIHGKQDIKGADIRKKTLEEMIVSVNSYHKVMPRYYLTNDEVKAIYDFLQQKNEAYLGLDSMK
jgi:hypothetical protein